MEIKVLTYLLLLLGLKGSRGRSLVSLAPQVENDEIADYDNSDSLNDNSPQATTDQRPFINKIDASLGQFFNDKDSTVQSGPSVSHSHPGGGLPHSHPGGGLPHSHPGGGFPHSHPGGGLPHSHPGGGFPHSHIPNEAYGVSQQGGWPYRGQPLQPWNVPNRFTPPFVQHNQFPPFVQPNQFPSNPTPPFVQPNQFPPNPTPPFVQPNQFPPNPTPPFVQPNQFPPNLNSPAAVAPSEPSAASLAKAAQLPPPSAPSGQPASPFPGHSGPSSQPAGPFPGPNAPSSQPFPGPFVPSSSPASAFPQFPQSPNLPNAHPWWRQPPPPPQSSLPSFIPNKPIPYTNIPPNKSPNPGIPNKTPSHVPYYPHPPFNLNPSPLETMLPKEECISYKGELGECSSYQQCGLQGGVPSGLCHLGHDVSAHARTCCTFPSFCGYETNKEVTYFKNPNYPNVTKDLANCLYRVNLLPGVCQVRVDFLDLNMKPMVHGECDPSNSLKISSNDRHAYIPINNLCGTVAEDVEDPLRTDIPHIYVHVDDDIAVDRPSFQVPNHDHKSVTFRFKVSDFTTKWNLRISQIQCDGANLQAAQGCAQFYNQNKGNITSFNLADGSYPNSMDMSVCILKDPSACGIHYKLKTFGVGPTKGSRAGKQSMGYGLVCHDYVVFNGEKTCMCGGINTAKDIILPVRGPQGFTIRSDASHIPQADVGYHIEYEYLHNCTDTVFYKYPSAVKN